jgi:hypothetical protein
VPRSLGRETSDGTEQSTTPVGGIPNRSNGDNADAGIRAGSSVVRGCSASANDGDGILVFNQSLVVDNIALGNTGDGIDASLRSSVHGNSVADNFGFGLRLGDDSGYRENVISQGLNGVGTVDGGVDMGDNVCNGSLTCP